jgi:S-adenosyl methyltransferase
MTGPGSRPDDQVPPGVDPAVPTAARIYDYLLGGQDNFAADRAACGT